MTVTALLVVVVFVMELIVLGGSLGFICGEKKGRELFFIYRKKKGKGERERDVADSWRRNRREERMKRGLPRQMKNATLSVSHLCKKSNGR